MIRVSASTLLIEEPDDVAKLGAADRLADALREVDSGKSSAGRR